MIAYYQFLEDLRNHLQNDSEVNTVVFGSLSNIDNDKRSIFGLAHILVSSGIFLNGVVQFVVTISVMDVVDEDKLGIEQLPNDEQWKGDDSRQDASNNMLGILFRLWKALDREEIGTEGTSIEVQGEFEPFEDRFANLLTGWSQTYTINVPNTVQNC